MINYPIEATDACFGVEERSFWFRHRNRALSVLLERWPVAGSFADVGGGNGIVAAHLARLGLPVVMIEPSASGCDHARARGVPRVIQGTLESAGIGTAALGGIGAFDMVEHLEDAGEFCRLARVKLVEGGHLYVSVPAHSGLWSQADVLILRLPVALQGLRAGLEEGRLAPAA